MLRLWVYSLNATPFFTLQNIARLLVVAQPCQKARITSYIPKTRFSTSIKAMSKRSEIENPIEQHPSTKRAKHIDEQPPYDELKELLESQAEPDKTTKVVHWFRSKDLRIQDNKALHDAFATAKEASAPLICAYVNCSPEFMWHGTSPARCDFILETLSIMQQELKELDIPLVFLDASERDEIVPTISNFVKDQKVSHVFANYEYEIDEFRRDIKFLRDLKDDSIQVALRHDQTVMEPGTMVTGAGKPMKVFTPYHKAWLGEVKDDPSLLDTVASPSKQPGSKSEIQDLFDSKVPTPPKEKEFASKQERDRIRKLWPAGHDEGMKRMRDFIQNKIEDYAATRSNPAKDSSSRMSAYFAAGVVSMREALTAVMKHNDNSADFSQSGATPGVAAWVREIVFRELYRQTTLTTPHTAMNLPQNLKFDFVQWEEDDEGYKRWEEGTLGVPFVDAGMRQIKHEAYMHNRLRMNVSSYLYCNLLIDYRRGERYFAETLVDWDLSNNTQGWEPSMSLYCSSCTRR
jgi:deoxyribodipyrimidine photo-lyase